MSSVTIEGSDTPSTDLARGERTRVQLTPYVEMLIREGRVVVIDEETDEPEPTPPVEPVKAPSKGASRDDWAEFLAEHTDVVTEGRTRDELVGDYEVWLETHDAPAADTAPEQE